VLVELVRECLSGKRAEVMVEDGELLGQRPQDGKIGHGLRAAIMVMVGVVPDRKGVGCGEFHGSTAGRCPGPELLSRAERMVWIRGIVGVVLCVVGVVWIAQGSGAMQGSGMSGQGQFTVLGGAAVVVGVALVVWAARIRRRQAHI
jgi:hypothetical protein